MAHPDYNKTTTTSMETAVSQYSVDYKSSDAGSSKENKWKNNDFSKYYGFYHNVGEYKAAIDSFATWCVGQGYTVFNTRDKILLDHITGWGEDTFQQILWQGIVIKKVGGDSYTEIILDEDGDLLNLKPLNVAKMTHITNEKGILLGYEYMQADGSIKKFKTYEIFHLCNKRVIDEPHGTPETKSIEWVMNAIEEARRAYRKIVQRSCIRILYVDESDTAKLTQINTEYSAGIKNGEILIIPCRPEDAKFEDLLLPPIESILRWMEYLEDKFYKQLGVPKVVLGGTSENTEASAKVGVISYEPIWTMEISELEKDILNQLGIMIKINKQPSLMDNMQADESANTGQTKLEYQGSQ